MATLAPHSTGVSGPQDDVQTGRGQTLQWILAGALLIVVTYAIFAHGAIRSPAEPLVQVALELIAAAALAVGSWSGRRSRRLPRRALQGLGLLVAFTAWTGVSLAWSVAPDLTWMEFNRLVSYVLVLALALALGSSWRGASSRAAGGVLALVVLVALYGLGQKLLPGLHVAGLINLNQTGRIARLQEPIGYWNALALLFAMGAPLALGFAAETTSPIRVRIAAAVALQLILLAGGFTYSRGGLLALVVGMVVFVAIARNPARVLVWLAASGAAAVPPLALGLTSHALSADGAALGRRESAGLLLLVVLVGCAVVLTLGAERLIHLDEKLVLPAALVRRARRLLLPCAGVVLAIVVLGLLLSSRGLGGTLSHAWSSFVSPRGISVSAPSRLLSADSANRWGWWQEAIGAFWDRPLQGWGGGAFPVVHLLYRQNDLPVMHAHSTPLEWLAEAGLIGSGLAISALILLVRCGARALDRQYGQRDRLLAAAALAAVVAFGIHALYDWDWEIPGVTLPALALLGILAGSGARLRPAQSAVASVRSHPAARIATAAAGAVISCVLAVSSVLPSVAAGRASAALVSAAQTSSAALVRAMEQARAAARLDPLSNAGPLAEASVALHLRDAAAARAYLLEAVARQPSDEKAWEELGMTDIDLGRSGEAILAAQRLLEADTHNPAAVAEAATLAQRAELESAPPAGSASAIRTP